MTKTKLKIENDNSLKTAQCLDAQIRADLSEHALKFTEIGPKLRDMNLGGGYEHLGFTDPKSGWNDYLRSRDLPPTTALAYIRAALVMECFSDSAPSIALSPRTLVQCLKLANGVADMKVQSSARKNASATGGKGGGKASPVKVSNPEEVVEVWGEVVKRHEEAVERAEDPIQEPQEVAP
jgi:hypothetical protein